MNRRRVPIRVEKERMEEEPSTPEVEDAVAEEVEPDLEMWRDRALRLQAEMDNFRKRQRRTAEARVLEERERLLRAFLEVVDNLERALVSDEVNVGSLKRGVEVTHQAATRLLDQEGVEPVAAEGQAFDPDWHEAMGTLPAGGELEPGTVVEVVQRGYRLGDRLLRPARVIVAA